MILCSRPHPVTFGHPLDVWIIGHGPSNYTLEILKKYPI